MSARRFATFALMAIAAIASGSLLAQTPQAIGTWASSGTADITVTQSAAVALPDGRTLILGGVTSEGAPTANARIFDPVAGSFTDAGSLVAPRASHSATLLKDGRVAVVGGATDGTLLSTDIEIFDPATSSSMLVSLLPEPRKGHVAALLLDGTILIAGGSTTDGAVLQSAVVFNPTNGSVSSLPFSLLIGRVNASATTLLDGRVLIVGGNDGASDLASAEIYDRYSQVFSMAATQMAVPRQRHAAVMLPNNGGVLVAGGTSNGVAQSGADLFLPAVFPDPFSYGEGEFTATGAMTVARAGATAGPTSVEGYAFAAGGGSADAEVYRFATIKTDKDDYAPGELAVITGSGWQAGEEVTLLFQEDPAVHDDYVLTVTADGAGNIYWNQWAPDQHDFGVRFYLTATDSKSRAQTTFTDGNRVTFSTTANGAAITTFGTITANQCLSAFVQERQGNFLDTDGHAARVVNFESTPTGASFFSGPGCTTPATSVAILANATSAQFSFKIATPSASPYTIKGNGVGISGSANNASASVTVTAPTDTTKPTVTISSTTTSPTNASTIGVSVAFSEPVTGFVVGDLSITNGSASAFAGSGANYSFTLTPSTDGSVIVNIAADVAQDAAGNGNDAATSFSLVSDRTPPTIDVNRSPAANAAGWNNTNVMATYTASDALSGLASPDTGSFEFTAEGAGQSHTFTATDLAGNSNSVAITGVNIDKTTPTATATPTPAANGHGWNNTDVTVAFSGTDTLSGIASCTTDIVLSSEGAGQSASGSCTDLAGNSAPATASGINIDKTAPSISATRSPAANADGWNNTNVMATYDASDALSGLDSPTTGGFEFTGEGAGQSHTFTVTDRAGNSASAGITGVNIDKTAPTVAATAAPLANANGWNNTDVTVSFGGTDALSGIASCATDVVLSSEGPGQSASGSCTDKAGNSASATASNINIDKTVPSISASRTPAANANGWNNTNVMASYEASDALSGLDSPDSGSFEFTAEGAGQSHTFTVTDLAGNSASAGVTEVNIDKTAPVVTATAAPLANANGWNNTDVTVSFGGTDTLSGIASCAADVVLGEGAGQSASGSCTDKAGNTASATASGINVDKTAPSISASRTPAANAHGWNNTNVMATYTASDALSGLDSPDTGSFEFTGEGAGQSHTFTVTDRAGNSASAEVIEVNIDKTAPSVSATRAPLANANGWNNTDVTVSFAGTDGLSGIASCTTDIVLSSEGAGQSASGDCSDKAGNTASATASGINIDKTAPSISASRLPAANSYGWNNTNVMASYEASDALSGLDSPGSGSFEFTGEGAGQSHTFTVTDLAGNSASAEVTEVNIDKTAPTAAGTRAPLANANGWNNTDVTVSFAGTDGLSGIASCTTDIVLSSEGAGQSASGDCSDKAGNTASATVSNINIDKTAPSVSASRTPAANGHGWNNTNVMASYEASDALSGLDSPDTGSFEFTAEGASQSHTFTVTDLAGNSASADITAVNIDKTAPSVSATRAPLANANGWNNTDVTVSFAGTDGLSGIATCTGDIVLSSEGAGQSATGDCSDKAGNTAPATISDINIDKTAPSISASRVTLANAFGWNNTDVTVSYNATDALSGLSAPSTGTFDLSAEGAGQGHTFSVTDLAGNSASAYIGGINIDKTAPTLAPVVSPNPVLLNGTATATPNATDLLSGVQSQICPSVDTSSVGAQTLTCSATDKAGNVGSAPADYSVAYSWSGFLQPINDTAHQIGVTQSKFKLGQTVPAKFVLRNAAGVTVQQASNPQFKMSSNLGACSSYATLESAGQVTPDVVPVYKWDGAQYHFNWSTKGLSSGVYRIYAVLADGTQPWVDVCLTK